MRKSCSSGFKIVEADVASLLHGQYSLLFQRAGRDDEEVELEMEGCSSVKEMCPGRGDVRCGLK